MSDDLTSALLDRGVLIPEPTQVSIAADVDPGRIESGALLLPGARLEGASTLIRTGAKIGKGGACVVRDCAIGRDVELSSGSFEDAVFLAGASFGPSGHVRAGTLFEEGATAAHAVGTKQTILLPWATLGSNINACDLVLAGGTGAKDHSEIGSVFIHFNYTPFGHSDWQTIVGDVKKFGSAGKKTAVVSTINGDANVPFYKELGNQGIKAEDIPVVAFSVGEEELAGLDTTPLVGHLAAWNYFMSIDTPENAAFIDKWHAFIKDEKRVSNDPMEAHYIGFNMWVQAAQQAGTTDVDAVRQAMYGQKFKNLTGGIAVMNTNHHLSKPVLVGEIQADGQFETVWSTDGVVKGDAWTDFLPESAKLTADWTYPWICGNCEKPKHAATSM